MNHRSKLLLSLSLGLPHQAQAQTTAIELPADFISMAAVAGGETEPTQLVVFDADRSRPQRRRHLNWLTKSQGGKGQANIRTIRRQVVPRAAASFDICALDPKSPTESVIYLDAEGIVTSDGDRLVRTDTLLAHTRDDMLPKVRVCFPLIFGESPTLVVPRLNSVEVWRASSPRNYTRHASLPFVAGLRFFGQPIRASDAVALQRLSLRLEMPDVVAADYDGDGKSDLCFCREDQLSCHRQTANGFSHSERISHNFRLLTDAEDKDTSLKLDCRLVELTGDRRIDVILQKSQYNLSDMRTSLSIFPQLPSGGFATQPTQTITRTGYFAYQEFLDLDEDQRVDIVAPIADLSWTEIASIYLSRRADIEFVYYRNLGQGRFADKPHSLHSLSFPIDLKNWNAILGVLPIWQTRLLNRDDRRRQLIFLPDRAAIELYTLEAGKLSSSPHWRLEADLGSEVLRIDLDQNGLDELVFAYPRDPVRARRLLLVEATGATGE